MYKIINFINDNNNIVCDAVSTEEYINLILPSFY